MKRRIKKAKIKFISLVPKGANRLPTIFKEDGAFEAQLLVKDMDERGELTAVVYSPELRDSQGDIASAAVIKDALYDAAKEGVQIDIRHDGKAVAKDKVFIAEQFIIQKNDPRFDGMTDYDGAPVDPAGGWGVVIKVDDPGLRELYREGVWSGVSMGGTAEVIVTEKQDNQDVADRVVAALAKRLGKENDMALTKEELEQIAKTTAEAVVAGLQAVKKSEEEAAAAAAPAEPKEETPERPVFKGDPTDQEAVSAYRDELTKFELQQKLAKAETPEQVDEILKALKGETPAPKAAPSNQPVGSDQDHVEVGTLVGVGKEDNECAAIGLAMAKFING